MNASAQPRRRMMLLCAVLLLGACAATERVSVPGQGGARSAAIDRPVRHAGPRPLLVVLHAAMLSGDSTRSEFDMSEAARRAGIALVFPDAGGLVWNDGSLARALPRGFSGDDDIGFLDALIAGLVADGTADPDAIHIAGVSNGGMMALRYACQRADRLASVAVFMATMPAPAEQDCRPARPLHVMIVAGTADPVVRWTGEVAVAGVARLQQRMSVPESFGFWRRANGCDALVPPRLLERRGSGPHVVLHAAAGCADGVRTLLYEVRGGGHLLPGSPAWPMLWLLGSATQDVEAGGLLLGFVRDANAR